MFDWRVNQFLSGEDPLQTMDQHWLPPSGEFLDFGAHYMGFILKWRGSQFVNFDLGNFGVLGSEPPGSWWLRLYKGKPTYVMERSTI